MYFFFDNFCLFSVLFFLDPYYFDFVPPGFLLKSSVFFLLFSIFVVVFQELSQLCFPTVLFILVIYFYFPRLFHSYFS